MKAVLWLALGALGAFGVGCYTEASPLSATAWEPDGAPASSPPWAHVAPVEIDTLRGVACYSRGCVVLGLSPRWWTR